MEVVKIVHKAVFLEFGAVAFEPEIKVVMRNDSNFDFTLMRHRFVHIAQAKLAHGKFCLKF